MTAHDLPAINASLNGLAAVFIVAGLVLVKMQRTFAHIVAMSCALASSTFFLIGYIANHIIRHGVVTHFTAQGIVRPLYFALLISHTILAVAVVPLVICTVIPALRSRYDKHRRIAKITLPIWLYVSVTGVIVYLMLYRWFPPAL
jgi:putative membrane protein